MPSLCFPNNSAHCYVSCPAVDRGPGPRPRAPRDGLNVFSVAEFRKFAYRPRRHRTIDSYDADECWRLFRFEPEHLREMLILLDIPASFHLKNGTIVSGEEAMLIFFARSHETRGAA